MLVLLSPAKNLDLSPAPSVTMTEPSLTEDIAALSKVTAKLTRPKLRALMDISDQLAELNYERFQHFDDADALPAAFAFAGDVYRGLDARSLDGAALDSAQRHIRILSGMYGVLRPLDAMRPYRLEMGTRLKTPRGATLYDFWGERVTEALNSDLEASGFDAVINCASDEYFKVVRPGKLNAEIVTTAFYDIKDGKARQLFVFVKRARGLFARWVAENDPRTRDDLKAFESEGYRYDADASRDGRLAFSRPQPPKKS